MENQRRHDSRKVSLGGTSKSPDSFWRLIVPSARLEKGKPQQDTIPHSGHPPIEHAEEHKYAQPAESHRHGDAGERSRGQLLTRSHALHKADIEQDSSAGFEDTEWSDSDENYEEVDNRDDNVTDSDASSLATQMSQLSYVTHRRASASARRNLEKRSKEPHKKTVPKRKMTHSQLASAKVVGSRKRVKVVAEESDEDSDENCDEEPDEEEAAIRNVNRPAKGRARGKNLPPLPVLPPPSRKNRPWTTKEEEILFSLRKKGKSWKYIGEDVLGRTTRAVKGHWECLRTESFKPVKARSKGVRRAHNPSVLSAMAKTGNLNKPWSKEEDSILISLRAQGKTIRYISGRIRGRGIAACKTHWLKIKRQIPEKKSLPDHSPFFPVSQLHQDAKEPESNSRPAVAVVVKQKYPLSRRHSRSSSWPK